MTEPDTLPMFLTGRAEVDAFREEYGDDAVPVRGWTEHDMVQLLLSRYSSTSPGNGARYICAAQVRSHAGFDARRTCDFMAMDVWPSSGLPLHGHEIKVSRSDWLTELRDPSKAEEFRQYCDRWWLVVPDASIVRDDLPDGWGLIVGTRVKVKAPKLDPKPLPRTMLACLLRAATQTHVLRAMAGVPR